MGQLIVTGHSDDIICVECDLCEEFTYADAEGGDLVALSDGTVLRVQLVADGIWRINPVVLGPATTLTVKPCPENDPVRYSDTAILTTDGGPFLWAVHGTSAVTNKAGG